MNRKLMLALVSGLLVSSAAGAQGGDPRLEVDPKRVPTPAREPAPLPTGELREEMLIDTRADTDAERVVEMLSGVFEADVNGIATRFNAAPVQIEGFNNTVYFELTRADDAAWPFRQGVMQVYRRQGDLRLRVYDLDEQKADALVAMYLRPDAFPSISREDLDTNVEMALEPTSEGFRGSSPHPYPTLVGGAMEISGDIVIEPERIQLADRGFDADGQQVWGPREGQMYTFEPADPISTLTELEDGLISIDLETPDDAQGLIPGGTIVVHYSGWVESGKQFDSSRQEGREPFRVQIPGRLIEGWNRGMLGMAKGGHRRLIIPGPLAYGERGQPRAGIMPNATLIFEVEALDVDNKDAPQPTPDAGG